MEKKAIYLLLFLGCLLLESFVIGSCEDPADVVELPQTFSINGKVYTDSIVRVSRSGGTYRIAFTNSNRICPHAIYEGNVRIWSTEPTTSFNLASWTLARKWYTARWESSYQGNQSHDYIVIDIQPSTTDTLRSFRMEAEVTTLLSVTFIQQ